MNAFVNYFLSLSLSHTIQRNQIVPLRLTPGASFPLKGTKRFSFAVCVCICNKSVCHTADVAERLLRCLSARTSAVFIVGEKKNPSISQYISLAPGNFRCTKDDRLENIIVWFNASIFRIFHSYFDYESSRKKERVFTDSIRNWFRNWPGSLVVPFFLERSIFSFHFHQIKTANTGRIECKRDIWFLCTLQLNGNWPIIEKYPHRPNLLSFSLIGQR